MADDTAYIEHLTIGSGGSPYGHHVTLEGAPFAPANLSAADIGAIIANTVNTSKVVVSNTGWDPNLVPIEGLTTPTSSQVTVGGKYDLDILPATDPGTGQPNPQPGRYLWNIFGYVVNTGTAPITAVAARGRGNTVYALSSSVRTYGVNSQGHGAEITVGAFASEATANTTNLSDTLTGITPTEGGSSFSAGQPISGPNIPPGASILQVFGRPGAPTAIQMSAQATADGVAVAIKAQPAGTVETMGLLITGNGGTALGGGNPAGIAIQIQAYNSYSMFAKGVQFGVSSLTPAGKGVVFSSAVADRAISLESCTLTQALVIAGGSYVNGFLFSAPTFSGSVFAFSSVTAASGLSFAASCTFGTAAIVLNGHSIAFDTTTGGNIGTVSTQKMGFWGKTPITRPAGANQAAVAGTVSATYDATTIATLNEIIVKFNQVRGDIVSVGLIKGSA